MSAVKMPQWELYYVPCATALKGKVAFLRKYPNRDLRYGVEARWQDIPASSEKTVESIIEALRGFVTTLQGDRIWTGPEQQTFGAAKQDTLQYIRDTPDCYLSLTYRLKQHVWRCPIGYHNGKTIRHRATTEQDVIDWIVKLQELTDRL